MKKIINIFTLLLICIGSNAQTKFITAGRIEFEKKTNQFSQYESQEENTWIASLKKNYPKMVTDYYELYFTTDKSVFKMARENPDNKYLWGSKPSDADVIVKDHNKSTASVQRDVFEETYLIQDSIHNNEWRFTGETRTIAGFDCKKAIMRICDSVYVVAFYTDQIMVSSGPESFGGLPGMILGLAVPRLHITWFATKVELTEPSAAILNPKQKGKKTTWNKVSDDLSKAVRDWGNNEKDRIIWKTSL